MKDKNADSIEEYINQWPLGIKKRLKQIRKALKEAIPHTEEKISYGMPSFFLNGAVVYYAAFKDHIGYFPTPDGVSAFKEELIKYKTSKGTIQLPYDEPLPLDLLKKIAIYRAGQNSNKIMTKKTKRK